MIALINPNLIVQRNDPFTTGIVYMPLSLAYVAAALREAQIPLEVIDAYAQNPAQARRRQQFLVIGLTTEEILERIPANARAAFVYAINLTNHDATMETVGAIKRSRPDLPVVVLENTQAVTAYALQNVAEQFYQTGADYVLCGEGDRRAVRLAQLLLENAGAEQLRELDGLGAPDFFNPPQDFIAELDDLPFPAWDLFPLENYWNLRYAHGPQTTARYLPLLTSRGCPYPCEFCVVPATNSQRWRPRSAQNVVDV